MVEDAGTAAAEVEKKNTKKGTTKKEDFKDQDFTQGLDQHETGAGPQGSSAQTPLPSVEEIKDLVYSKATQKELELVRLYLLVRNYFQAMSVVGPKEPGLPRWALECYGMSREASCSVHYLVDFMNWGKPPSWEKFTKDEDGLMKMWDVALQAGKSFSKERWDTYRSSQTRRDPDPPKQYRMDDFLLENPEMDKGLEAEWGEDLDDPVALKDFLKRGKLEQLRLYRQVQWIQSQQELLQTQVRQPVPDLSSRELRRDEWKPWEEGPTAELNAERNPNLAETVDREKPQFRSRKSPVRRNDAGGRATTDVADPDMREEEDWRRKAQTRYPVPVFGGSRRCRSPSNQSSRTVLSERGGAGQARLERRLEYPDEPAEEFLRVERGAIKVPAGIAQNDVLPPRFDGRNPKDWLGFKTQFELYLAGRRATTVSAQKRLLLSCLDGVLRSEFAEKWETTMGDWIDLDNYWLQLHKRFTWGKREEHPSNPEAWMTDHPWDGFEWTLPPFLDGVVTRARNLLPPAMSDAMVASAAAKMIYERGLPAQLLRELNTKIRANPDLKSMQSNLGELTYWINEIFREYESSHTTVPWPQGTPRGKKPSTQGFAVGRDQSRDWKERAESQGGPGVRDQDRSPSRRSRSPERRRSRGEELRRKFNEPSPFPSFQNEPRGYQQRGWTNNENGGRINIPEAESRFPNQQQAASGRGAYSTPQQRYSASPAGRSPSPGRPWCDHCGKPGHFKATCWLLNEKTRPPWYRSPSRERSLQVLEPDEIEEDEGLRRRMAALKRDLRLVELNLERHEEKRRQENKHQPLKEPGKTPEKLTEEENEDWEDEEPQGEEGEEKIEQEEADPFSGNA